jgi:hypothetical protein
LLSLPAKKPANAYNISSDHFASCAGIADAEPRRPCSMSAWRQFAAWIGMFSASGSSKRLAAGCRWPAEHEQDLRHQLTRDR